MHGLFGPCHFECYFTPLNPQTDNFACSSSVEVQDTDISRCSTPGDAVPHLFQGSSILVLPRPHVYKMPVVPARMEEGFYQPVVASGGTMSPGTMLDPHIPRSRRVIRYTPPRPDSPLLRIPEVFILQKDLPYPSLIHQEAIVAVVGARDVYEADAAIFYDCLRHRDGPNGRSERRYRRDRPAENYQMFTQLVPCHVQMDVCSQMLWCVLFASKLISPVTVVAVM